MPTSFHYALGVDIGGTFTDVVLINDTGQVKIAKGLSTPGAFDRGIADILDNLLRHEGLDPAVCSAFVHGTTVATNAIIERTGARTGLITTKGFRDVLELRRIRIPKLYDLTWQKPQPLVERYLRLEVVERMNHRGEVHTPLDDDSVVTAVKELKRLGAESIAVCLLNSYANPTHERAVREIVRAVAPEIEVTISSDVLAEMREYERTSTTVINAYLMPGGAPLCRRPRPHVTPTGLRCSPSPNAVQRRRHDRGARLRAADAYHRVRACRRCRRGAQARQTAKHRQRGHPRHRRHHGQGEPCRERPYAEEYDVGGGFSRGGQLQRGGG
jgi:N-methylhydantoinase A